MLGVLSGDQFNLFVNLTVIAQGPAILGSSGIGYLRLPSQAPGVVFRPSPRFSHPRVLD